MSIELIHKKEVLRRYSKNLQLFKAFLRGACVKTNTIDHSLKFNRMEATLYKAAHTINIFINVLTLIHEELTKYPSSVFGCLERKAKCAYYFPPQMFFGSDSSSFSIIKGTCQFRHLINILLKLIHTHR